MSEADKEKKVKLIRAMSDAEDVDGFEFFGFLDENKGGAIVTANITGHTAMCIIHCLIKHFGFNENHLATILNEIDKESIQDRRKTKKEKGGK